MEGLSVSTKRLGVWHDRYHVPMALRRKGAVVLTRSRPSSSSPSRRPRTPRRRPPTLPSSRSTLRGQHRRRTAPASPSPRSSADGPEAVETDTLPQITVARSSRRSATSGSRPTRPTASTARDEPDHAVHRAGHGQSRHPDRARRRHLGERLRGRQPVQPVPDGHVQLRLRAADNMFWCFVQLGSTAP